MDCETEAQEGDRTLLRPSVSIRLWMTAQVARQPIGFDFHCTKLLRTQWFSLCLGSGRKESWKLILGWGIGEGPSGLCS